MKSDAELACFFWARWHMSCEVEASLIHTASLFHIDGSIPARAAT